MLTDASILDPGLEGYVDQFECADEPDVALYLKELACRHHQQKTTSTRLFFNESGELVGYFTLLNDLVEIGKGKRADRNWAMDPDLMIFPAVKIHYIGVDSRYRLMGYGSQILAHALSLCLERSESVGCNFVTAEVKAKRIEFFQKRGFDFCSRKPASCFTADKRHVNMAANLLDFQAHLTRLAEQPA